MTTNEIGKRFNKLYVPSLPRRSGAMYSNLASSFNKLFIAAQYSSSFCVEFNVTAGTPASRSSSTWFFINDNNGEMTIVMPGNIKAGIW